ISSAPATQIRCGNGSILVLVSVSLHQPQGDHCIGRDTDRATRHTRPLGELVEGSRSRGQVLEQPNFVGDKQVLGGHEARGQLDDGVWCDTTRGCLRCGGHSSTPFSDVWIPSWCLWIDTQPVLLCHCFVRLSPCTAEHVPLAPQPSPGLQAMIKVKRELASGPRSSLPRRSPSNPRRVPTAPRTSCASAESHPARWRSAGRCANTPPVSVSSVQTLPPLAQA